MLTSRRHAGFTLTELIIAVAILAVLLSIAAPSYRQWLVNSQIRVKAESVLNGLQLARVEALKRNTSVFFDIAADTSWTIGCVSPVPDNDLDGIADCPAVIQSKMADEGGGAVSITITPISSSRVTYNGMGAVRALNPDGTSAITKIDLDTAALPSSQSRELRILAASGGLARLCDPSIATTGDPRKC